jgi:hypothetical protein
LPVSFQRHLRSSRASSTQIVVLNDDRVEAFAASQLNRERATTKTFEDIAGGGSLTAAGGD